MRSDAATDPKSRKIRLTISFSKWSVPRPRHNMLEVLRTSMRQGDVLQSKADIPLDNLTDRGSAASCAF